MVDSDHQKLHFECSIISAMRAGYRRASIESYLSEFYENLSDRYRQIDEADDIALAPEELFLTAEELRQLIPARQRLSCARSVAPQSKQILSFTRG